MAHALVGQELVDGVRTTLVPDFLEPPSRQLHVVDRHAAPPICSRSSWSSAPKSPITFKDSSALTADRNELVDTPISTPSRFGMGWSFAGPACVKPIRAWNLRRAG